jgi:hypothetical protein
VFDPHTQLKRLGRDLDALAVKRTRAVPRAVAERQKERVAGDLTGGGTNRTNAPRGSRIEHEALEARVPVEPDTERLHPASEDREDPVKAVGADVCPRIVEDLGRRATGDQLLQTWHLKRVIHARVQLAVRVGSGAALAEQQIRLGVRHAGAVKPNDVRTPLFQLRAAVDQVDGDAVGAEHQRRIQTGRTGPDHHDVLVSTSRSRFFNPETAYPGSLDDPTRTHRRVEHGPAIGRIDHQVGVHDEAQPASLPATASIDRPARDTKTAHPVRVDAGDGGGTLAQHALRLVQAHLDVEHAPGAHRRTLQMERGPPSTRAGSSTIDRSSSNTALTVMPTSRKGSRSNQTSG